MRIRLRFHSYFKDLTGCAEHWLTVEQGATIESALRQVRKEFPKLVPMKKSTLVAVGVEYQLSNYVLQEGDELSLFPPVQGG